MHFPGYLNIPPYYPNIAIAISNQNMADIKTKYTCRETILLW